MPLRSNFVRHTVLGLTLGLSLAANAQLTVTEVKPTAPVADSTPLELKVDPSGSVGIQNAPKGLTVLPTGASPAPQSSRVYTRTRTQIDEVGAEFNAAAWATIVLTVFGGIGGGVVYRKRQAAAHAASREKVASKKATDTRRAKR